MPQALDHHEVPPQESNIIKTAQAADAADAGLPNQRGTEGAFVGPTKPEFVAAKPAAAPLPAAKQPKKSSGLSTATKAKADPAKVAAYLEGKPLAAVAHNISESEYGATIVGICAHEQWECSRAPGNNYWGIMCGKGVLCKYPSLEAGVSAIDALLTKYAARGRDTIEELNGYYVVPASKNWYNHVIKVRAQVLLIETP